MFSVEYDSFSFPLSIESPHVINGFSYILKPSLDVIEAWALRHHHVAEDQGDHAAAKGYELLESVASVIVLEVERNKDDLRVVEETEPQKTTAYVRLRKEVKDVSQSYHVLTWE